MKLTEIIEIFNVINKFDLTTFDIQSNGIKKINLYFEKKHNSNARRLNNHSY